MKLVSTYLEKLKFLPKLNNKFSSKYITNPRLVILVILTILVFGTISFTRLPKTLNPEVNIPIIAVTTILPGAGPADIESLITIPLEDALKGIADLNTISSTSRNSTSSIILEFNSKTKINETKNEVQSIVDSLNELPRDAEDPKVYKVDLENQPVWYFTIINRNPKDDLASLIRFGEKLKKQIEKLPAIKSVAQNGLEEQEIQIVIKPEILQKYSLDPLILAQLIKSLTSAYPAGSVDTEKLALPVNLDQEINSIENLRNIQISLNSQKYLLSNIAEIYEKAKPEELKVFYANNETPVKRAITFSVFKTKSTNIDTAAENLKKIIYENEKEYPNFKIISNIDLAEMIGEQSNELLNNFKITIILVFLSLFFFIGIRQATVASLTIPLTFLITFIIMDAQGISINFLSLYSLLIALGLLLDDAIVIISAITTYYKTGKFTAQETGILVWRDFIIPIWTTTITTVWAFVPLLLATGIIGEFIKAIPIIVSTTLLASTTVAVLITLPLMIILLNPKVPNRVKTALKVFVFLIILALFSFILPQSSYFLWFAILGIFSLLLYQFKNKIKKIFDINLKENNPDGQWKKIIKIFKYRINHGIFNFHPLSLYYKKIIYKIISKRSLRVKVLIMVIIFSLASYSLLPLGFVKNEFFPKSDSDFILINFELPVGIKLELAQKEALNFLESLRAIEGVEFITAEVGKKINETENIGSGEYRNILYTVNLKPKKERKISSMDIAQRLRTKEKSYPAGKMSIIEQSGGPPAGADVQIKLLGEDLKELDRYANKVQTFLKNQTGVENIQTSITQAPSKLVFMPDQKKVAEQGLSLSSIALYLRAFTSGYVLDDIRFSNDKTQNIVLRIAEESQKCPDLDYCFPQNNQGNIQKLNNITLPTQQGTVALASLGSFQLKPNVSEITREQGQKTISVSASVASDYPVIQTNKALEKFANTDLNLAQGYSWKTGGMNEENQKSIESVMRAMILAIILIFSTMVIQFRSFRQALMIVIVIPLAVSGVFIAFSVTRTPLSFPALIGVLALFGIVVNNSIVIIDKINYSRYLGIKLKEAIADGSAGRLEAISLSSLTTIMGLAPITISDPIWRGFGGAVISGLLLSGTIMLFFIPVVYYMWFKKTT